MKALKTLGRALAAAAFLAAASAGAQTTVLRFSDLFPAAYPFGALSAQFAKDVKERTGGKVEVQVFPSGTLTPPPQCYEGVLQGLSDICQAVLAYTPGRFPVMESVDLPGYPNSGRLTTRVANDVYQKFQPRELDAVKVLYLHAHPPGSLMTVNKPVKTLDDLKGMKMRSTGLSARIVTALGGSPVSMPITQAYDPLKRGVLDGTDGTFNALKYYRFAEVTKYTTMATDVGYVSTFAVVMNKAKWNALPADVRTALDAVSREYMVKAGDLWDQIEREGLAFGREKGHEFIRLDPKELERWRAAVIEPLHTDYVKRVSGSGLPGEEIVKAKRESIKRHSAAFPALEVPVK
ncbi:TRAP transporter substrate-binding protein [Ramlibacter henchirensis]|uniref:TRAP transporter substrate-binding protein n=1 Tax=Ramlibacter henchirensis TaxID=204072 RepID=A0A4Z0BQC1_9BURK|nr:TRAP transporter substrate-binding protein [Ramlibacter henchirensis]TFZ00590.1 TRAP transporter substrate-binding protein [Ramlibacter henchirensis]